jgi:hypothetical protein
MYFASISGQYSLMLENVLEQQAMRSHLVNVVFALDKKEKNRRKERLLEIDGQTFQGNTAH